MNWNSFGIIKGGRSPLYFKVTYDGVTQFAFKFKAPVTSTLDIYDGDGTMTQVAGNNAVLVTHNTTYASAGVYYFYVLGDYEDITAINIGSQSFVKGSVNRWNVMSNLDAITISDCDMTGNFTAFNGLTIDRLSCGNTSIIGDISRIVFDTSPSFISITELNTRFKTTPVWTFDSCSTVHLGNNMSVADVERALISTSTCTNCGINLSWNEAPTSAIADDILTSVNNGNILHIKNPGVIHSLDSELHTDANAASDPNLNEADAVTGWSQTYLDSGSNIFASQSSVVRTGNYAIEANANDTPTQGADFSKTFTVVTNDIIRTDCSIRHIGTGGLWRISVDGLSSGNILFDSDANNTTNSWGETWLDITSYIKATDTSHSLRGFEVSLGNNGGVYIDDVSVRKVIIS